MGLTIHFSFKFKGSAAEAQALVCKLYLQAVKLFPEVQPVTHFTGNQLKPAPKDKQWVLKFSGRKMVVHKDKAISFKEPTELIGFIAYNGPGCEPLRVGLARCNATNSWHWQSFCKTQYASNPEHGGAKNFVTCHLRVITLLKYAKSLGLIQKVDDGGHFWESGDPQLLVAKVTKYNQFIAAFAGQLKDQMDTPVVSEITKFPDFENLEAAGMTNNKQIEAAVKRILHNLK